MVMFLERPRFDPTSKATSGEESTLSEIWNATDESMRLGENADSRLVAFERAYDKRIDEIKGAVGTELSNPVTNAVGPSSMAGFGVQEETDPHAAFQSQIEGLAEQHPEQREIIAPHRPVSEDAKALALSAEKRSEDVWSRSSGGLAAWSARLGGGFYGAMHDPVNVFTMGVGPAGHAAKGAKGLLWMGLKQGAANAATEAAIQPAVQSWRKEAGMEHGLGQAALNVGGAAAFGFVLDAGVRSVIRGGRLAVGRPYQGPDAGGVEPSGARLPGLPEGRQPAGEAPEAPAPRVYRGADPLPPMEALEQAARNAPEGSTLRRAADGDEDALVQLAEETGQDGDPVIRRIIAELETEKRFRGIAPLHVDGGEHHANLARAIIGESGGPALPVGDAIVAPIRREIANLADEAVGRALEVEGRPVGFRPIDPRQVTTDASTFQFKSGGDTAGVTDRLRGVTRWDPVSAGKAIVFERADGTMVIADGHQRLGLAKRVASEGQDAKLDAYVFREADGWTPEDVRAYAALKNMRESSGTSVDMAQVMRDRPDLIDGSLPLTDAKLRDAAMLARLSPEAFDAVVAGRLPPPFAALIGESVADATRHAGLLNEMADAGLANTQQARAFLKQAMEQPSTIEVQQAVLGGEASRPALSIDADETLHAGLLMLRKDKRIAALMKQAGAEEASSAAQLAELIEKLATSRGTVATILNDAAASVARGLDPKLASRAFVDRIADTLEREGLPGLVKVDEAPAPDLAPVRMDDPLGPEAKAQAEDINWALTLDDEIKFAIRGFHGSPHDFPPVNLIEMPDGTRLYQDMRAKPDMPEGARVLRHYPAGRFDMSKIGTGEGAQVFGHGLYFAENKTVADQYRDALSFGQVKIDGNAEADPELASLADAKLKGLLGEREIRAREWADEARAALNAPPAKVDKDSPLAAIMEHLPEDRQRDLRDAEEYLAKIEKVKAADVTAGGSVYEVDIDVEPHQLLDWDLPLREQPEGVRRKIAAKFERLIKGHWDDFSFGEGTLDEALESYTGKDLYDFIVDDVGRGRVFDEDMLGNIPREDREMLQVAASKALREAGIPGIRYLDQGSRDAGEGTRNIVIFDDSLITITKKNGEAVTAKERQEAVDAMFGLRGFYSPAIRAAESISMKKGTGEQFWKQITKTPNVRKDELDWMGLEEFLAGKKSVTRDEVLAFMRAHQVELDEKSFGGRSAEVTEENITSASQAQRLGLEIENEDLAGLDEAIAVRAKKATVLISKEKGTSFYTVHDPFSDQTLQATSRDQAKHMAYGLLQENVTDTRFAGFKVPGGENYRELLIRLPSLEGKYTSKHFEDQELVHLRVDDRTDPNGEKVLFINEVQSDNHQQAQLVGFTQESFDAALAKAKAGVAEKESAKAALSPDDLERWYESSKPEELEKARRRLERIVAYGGPAVEMPFKGDLWLELALKRALLYASENGYDAISWARSDQIAKAVGAEPEKLALQYDSKIGKFLDKYTKKWGAKVEEGAPSSNRDAEIERRFAELGVTIDDLTFGPTRFPREQQAEIYKLIEERNAIKTAVDFTPGEQSNPILRVTPQMRASVMEGQPLAMRGGQASQPPAPPRNATLHNTTLSARASEQMASVRAEIDKAVAKSLPAGWRAEVRQSLVFGDLSERIQKRNPGVPPSLEIEGTFDPYERIIYVSMAALDPVERAFEEAGHAIKAMRLIPQADYSILQAKALEIGARAKFRIDERYGDVYGARWKDNPARLEEALEEEAIMQMVAARARGDDFGKQSNVIIDKLLKFLRAVRDMLGIKGFRSFEDVFEDMTEGGFARQMDAQRGGAGAGRPIGGEVMAATNRGAPGQPRTPTEVKGFHGTGREFETFDEKFFGSRSESREAGEAMQRTTEKAFFFSDDTKLADSYAEDVTNVPFELRQEALRSAWTPDGKYNPRIAQEKIAKLEEEYYVSGARVLPVFIETKNFKTVDMKGYKWSSDEGAKLRTQINKARKEGKSGIIIENMVDGSGSTARQYAVWDKGTVRSALSETQMFALPESPTATDASFIARAEAASEIMFALGDEGKGKTPEGKSPDAKSPEAGGEAKPAPERAAAAPSPSAPAKTPAPILPGGRESKRIRNLINQAAAEGKLPREDADALIERYDALEQFHKDGGKAKQQIAKELTAEAEHRKRQKGLAEIAKRKVQSAMISFRDARGQADPAKAMQALIENLGQHELPQGMVSVANHQHAIFGVAMAELDGVLHEFRKTFVTGQTRNKARLSNVVRELKGEKTGDEMAAAFATAVAGVMENLRLRFNAAGGAIGKLANWGLPQWHDAVALIRAGKQAWIEFVEPLLDPKSLKHSLTGDPLSPADVKAMLSDVWDTIASDGWHEKEAEMGRRGLSAIANTRGDPRSLVFANADAWMKYSERFGGGPDALGIIVGHIKSMSRDIAAMEVLGPNPANMLKFMQDFVSQQAKLSRAGMTAVFPRQKEISGRGFADPTSYAKMMNDRTENMWNIYSGRASAPVNAVMAEYSQGVRNINVFTKLGGAAVSGLGDLSWQIIARKFAGLPVSRMAKDILDQIKPGGERAARRAGVIAESYMHMHNEGAREGAALSFTGVTNYLSERVLTLSMLNGVTRAGNHAMGMGIQGHFADLTGKAFGELTPQIQRTLRRWGLDAVDWEAMRLDAAGNPREVDFLSPVEIRKTLAAGGGDPAIAERYLAMIIGESQYATLTGTIRGQAIMRGSTRAGTTTGELIRHLGQFKTFAVNLYILQVERMAREFVSQGFSRGAQYAALALAVAVAGGAMVEQLQQLRNFKDPRDMTTSEFWGAALYRSGGMSIWGDLLYATESRHGAGIAGVVAGPTAGTATDFAQVTYGALRKRLVGTDEKTNFGREASNVLRRYTPGASLWYVRAAWERVLMDNLQRMVDPEAEASFRRKIQNAKRDYKQDFWWKPGTSSPQRGPRLGAAVPMQ
jgi:hypothetical protein